MDDRTEWIPLEENGYNRNWNNRIWSNPELSNLKNGLDPVGSVGPATLKKIQNATSNRENEP
ncbi:MAG: hypothetical protein ACLRUL_10685 [Clostridia bacterium]